MWLLLLISFTYCIKFQQVRLSVSPDEYSLLTVWSTDVKCPFDSWLKYGLTRDISVWNKVPANRQQNYSYQGYNSGFITEARMVNLHSNETYHYVVGCGSEMSKIFTFNTLSDKKSTVFGLIADMGTTYISKTNIASLTKELPDLLLHAGDLSYANLEYRGGPIWDTYGDMLEPLVSVVPYQSTVGEHESYDNFTAYRMRYASSPVERPSAGTDFHYRFTFGLVRCYVLSTETPYDRQFAWMLEDLSHVNRSKTPWLVAMFHRPWYSSNMEHKKDGEVFRKEFESLLIKYKFDFVLSGHVHAYERTYPIHNYEINHGDGIVHIYAGTGGTIEGLDSNWVKEQPNWSAFRVAEHGYGLMTVYNSTMLKWQFKRAVDGKVLDEIIYNKY